MVKRNLESQEHHIVLNGLQKDAVMVRSKLMPECHGQWLDKENELSLRPELEPLAGGQMCEGQSSSRRGSIASTVSTGSYTSTVSGSEKSWSELGASGRFNSVVFKWIGKGVCLLLLLYIFICSLDLLSSAFRILGGKPTGSLFSYWELFQNPITGLMIGILATVLVQSHITITSIVVTMVASGMLEVNLALLMVLGAAIGTIYTRIYYSNHSALRRAFSGGTIHDLFNCLWLSVIILLPIEWAAEKFMCKMVMIFSVLGVQLQHLYHCLSRSSHRDEFKTQATNSNATPETMRRNDMSKDDCLLRQQQINQENQEESEYRLVDKHILYNIDKEIGKGRSSIVFEGRLENRNGIKVAVKRIEIKNQNKRKECVREYREVTNLRQLEQNCHENVVGYYLTEIKSNFLFIAFELCQATLRDYVGTDYENQRKLFLPIEVMRCMASGLKFLHSEQIVHRDLKPDNVLLKVKNGMIGNVVLGDFGSSKCTTGIPQQFSLSGETGSYGYISREICEAVVQNKGDNSSVFVTVHSDIFALGILFYYTLSLGHHPFGPVYNQMNIHKGKEPDLDKVPEDQQTCKVLIRDMVSHEPSQRPSAEHVCEHPAFWSATECLHNLQTWYNNYKCNTQLGTLQQGYLEDTNLLLKQNWIKNLPQYLQNFLAFSGKGSKIKQIDASITNTVWFLLKSIRNIEAHFEEIPLSVKKDIGIKPEDRLAMWMRICPNLILHLHKRLGSPTQLQFPV